MDLAQNLGLSKTDLVCHGLGLKKRTVKVRSFINISIDRISIELIQKYYKQC